MPLFFSTSICFTYVFHVNLWRQLNMKTGKMDVKTLMIENMRNHWNLEYILKTQEIILCFVLWLKPPSHCRFQVLWRFRYQVWPRMEDGANAFFKVPPPSIDFVLPSPTIGLPCLTVVDPPWLPHFKTKVEEVTINQEGSVSYLWSSWSTKWHEKRNGTPSALISADSWNAAG